MSIQDFTKTAIFRRPGKVLVTGGGGFLGRYIVAQLVAQGESVRVLGRHHYPDLEAIGVECHRGDLRDVQAVSEACRGVKGVIHTAALAAMWGRWEDFQATNVVGTENVIGSCIEHGVKRLVYTSSPSVVFGMADLAGVDESQPYPAKFYAYYPQSKAQAEQRVLEANGENGMTTCALRPHLIWGPRDPHIVPLLARRAQAGQLVQVGDGQNLVDLTYVENAAQAHLLAFHALDGGDQVAGRAYFISDGQPVNLWDWVRELLRRLNLPPVKRRLPYSLGYGLAGLLEFLHGRGLLSGEPRLTRFTASNFAKSHYFCINRARDDFDYRPGVTNEEGLQRTVAWFEANRAQLLGG